MAIRLNKFEFYIVDSATGLPVVSALVTPRRQGATVVSGGPTNFVINNPGAIRFNGETGTPATDSLQAFTPAGVVRDATIRTVTALTAITVNVGTGFTGVVDDDRLSPSTNLPTGYEDSEGTETKSFPLTTDSNGYCYCWMQLSVCDAYVDRGGSNIRLLLDQGGAGGDFALSSAWGTGSAVLHEIDTVRALAAGDKLFRGAVQTVEKFSFDKDGKLTLAGGLSVAAAATFASTASFASTLTVSAGGIAVTGNSTLVGTLGSLTGITMTSGDFDTTGVTTAIRSSRIKANRGTTVVSGDFTLGAGWGTGGANVSGIIGSSKDSRGGINITSGTAAFSANPTVIFTFKDGDYVSGQNTIPIAYVTKTSGTRLGYLCALDGTSTTAITWAVIGLTPGVTETFQLVWHTIG